MNSKNQLCGKNQAVRIVGGSESLWKWPWMAKLTPVFFNSTSGQNESLSCGGSLIDKQWVLTAAHCLESMQSELEYIETEIVLGEFDTTYKGTSKVYLSASKDSTIIHDQYERPNPHDNDIALLRLNETLDLHEVHIHLEPICLPTGNFSFEDCVATGWGDLSKNGPSADVLQEVDLPILDDEYCSKKNPNFDAIKQLCAGYEVGGADTCQGDSGGPLNCPLKNNVWVLHGITSWGKGCAKSDSPGYYIKVKAYMDWIKEKTNLRFN